MKFSANYSFSALICNAENQLVHSETIVALKTGAESKLEGKRQGADEF